MINFGCHKVEVFSHSVHGEPPVPIKFILEIDNKVINGFVYRILQRRLKMIRDSVRYEYRCVVETDKITKPIDLIYERDTMKWFIKV